MVNKARRDYMQLPFLYGAAILLVLFFCALSVSIDVSRFGIVFPIKEKAGFEVYNPYPFQDVDVKAKAYVVYDLVEKKVIASKNAEEAVSLASITKVMTALTALSHNPQDTKIKISGSNIDGGYDLGLKNGQVWKLNELVKYMLVFSSNDGAYAIATTLGGMKDFVTQMNTDSALNGLGLTFTDPAGLDTDGVMGGRGTALDVAKLFGIVRRNYPEIFEATTRARASVTAAGERLTGVPNTNQRIGELFGAEASKTGYTDLAGGNLGVIIDISLGHPVVIVVLGSTREERFTDTEKLYEALLKSVE
jgi:D-alanyl-D-alanine carboxypeptidase